VNCSDFKGQVGAWALGALSASEARAMEGHLAETSKHEGCEGAADQARLTAAQLALSVAPVRPGERVWPAIEARLSSLPKEIARPSSKEEPPTRGRRAPWMELVLWAAAAGLAVTLKVVNDDRVRQTERADRDHKLLAEARGLLSDHERCLRDLQEMKGNVQLQRDAMALLQLPETKLVALAPAVSGSSFRGSAIVNLAEHRTIIVSSALPRLRDQDFELWVIRGNQAPVAAGLMHQSDEGITVGEIAGNLLQGPPPDAFAVSREAKGGSATGKPSEAILLVGKLSG
jgi:anti-sigma-K factor RskA